MSILKTGFIAASFCLVASFAHADSSVPVQGLMSWNSAAKSSYASAQPRMAKTWNTTKAAPFSREAMEEKTGH
jgi:hypothetical protein